tara:strand:- start:22 stop:177 length:156 start_codon:yes stop_codon:yes gene_type:complete
MILIYKITKKIFIYLSAFQITKKTLEIYFLTFSAKSKNEDFTFFKTIKMPF